MKLVLIATVGALLMGCHSAPIRVTPQPDIAAVRLQNETTKKQIKTFTEHNTKTREHIDKTGEEASKESGNLQSVKKDLEQLLKE